MEMLVVRMELLVVVCMVLLGCSYGITQLSDETDPDKRFLPIQEDNDTEYMTWQNRRLHTVDLLVKNNKSDANLGQDRWYTLKFYTQYPKGENEDSTIIYNWNTVKRTAFTYIYFENMPLGPEYVEYKITTNFFKVENTTKPLNNSLDFTKYSFKVNRTHIMMWINEEMAIKLFLRDLPKDLGDTKSFMFQNLNNGSMYKIYYWDPTVFCWTGCYDDELPNKFHFDRDSWSNGDYTKDVLGEQCEIVNCTHTMIDSDFPRCVRLYHTPQGEDDQKVLLSCTNENYTYQACENFPDKPCWYEVCDNYDVCNSATSLISALSLVIALLTLQ